MTGTSHGNVFDYFNTFSAVLDWWFLSKPVCQKLSYLVSRVLDLKDTATLQFTNLLFNYRSGILSENKNLNIFAQVKSECAKMTEKMMAYQKMFIGPLV